MRDAARCDLLGVLVVELDVHFQRNLDAAFGDVRHRQGDGRSDCVEAGSSSREKFNVPFAVQIVEGYRRDFTGCVPVTLVVDFSGDSGGLDERRSLCGHSEGELNSIDGRHLEKVAMSTRGFACYIIAVCGHANDLQGLFVRPAILCELGFGLHEFHLIDVEVIDGFGEFLGNLAAP